VIEERNERRRAARHETRMALVDAAILVGVTGIVLFVLVAALAHFFP
jgi:multisubunit Na+/H+ antiporter MnhB subunit